MGSKGRPYRTVVVDGYEILVGRSASDNDYLTLEVADKNDLWLHAAGGIPGSHVVVRNPTGEPIDRDVVEKAAQLAAWYSKARGAPRVEVHVCLASNVRKTKGAPAGQVQIRNFDRLKVVPSRVDLPDDL